MDTRYLFAVVMAAGWLIAAPAFAQTAQAQKQPAQEGGGFETPCSLPFHADAQDDPNCKQRTQNLVPSSVQGAQEATGRK
jgi:hypothetical protein